MRFVFPQKKKKNLDEKIAYDNYIKMKDDEY